MINARVKCCVIPPLLYLNEKEYDLGVEEYV